MTTHDSHTETTAPWDTEEVLPECEECAGVMQSRWVVRIWRGLEQGRDEWFCPCCDATDEEGDNDE